MDAKDCVHKDFEAAVDVHRLLDTGKFIADVRIKCMNCGEPFRFLGVAAGVSWRQPMVSLDELELHVPIEPQGEPRLQAGASFEMPEIPTRH